MCAIAGIIGLPWDPQILKRLLSTMHHRGPDDASCYESQDAALLHSRLTIVDPSGGSQPMKLTYKRKTYVMVYNGELYNTEELRHDLIRSGHSFQSHSDTEVLLHAYAEYGETCVHKLNGIFAFAVWEEESGRLFLARDRIGVKPLCYTQFRNGFLFASEIKTILAYPGVPRQLDRTGVSQLILLGPGRSPGSGVLKDIYEVQPGCCGYWEDNKLHLTQYWKLRDREHRETFEETVECVRYLVTDAIRRQMVSDMPIGTFLSGGLDSSIITAVCAGELRERGERLPTFSVDYADNDRYFRSDKFLPDSDNTYIQRMVSTLDTDHHRTILHPEELATALDTATEARDLPGMADVDSSLLLFCGEIRQHVKVALSGECADEIFGGYPWYRDPEIRAQEGFPWSQNSHTRSSLLRPEPQIDASSFLMDAYRDTCRSADILPGTTQEERRMKEMVNLNFRWFMQTLLDRKDRMSMYHGLEVRVPFCDYRIAEYLDGVPWEFKDWQGREKGLLRKAVEDLLPHEVLYRKKSPYPKTQDPQYETLVTERMQCLLHSPSPLWEIIQKDVWEEQMQTANKWPWYGQLMRRPQTIAYFLQLDHWLKSYCVDVYL